MNEKTFIDAYINVHDGSEIEPIKKSKKQIREWIGMRKILEEQIIKE